MWPRTGKSLQMGCLENVEEQNWYSILPKAVGCLQKGMMDILMKNRSDLIVSFFCGLETWLGWEHIQSLCKSLKGQEFGNKPTLCQPLFFIYSVQKTKNFNSINTMSPTNPDIFCNLSWVLQPPSRITCASQLGKKMEMWFQWYLYLSFSVGTDGGGFCYAKVNSEKWKELAKLLLCMYIN